jgi:predicted alpha/beta superfamily hydrolase
MKRLLFSPLLIIIFFTACGQTPDTNVVIGQHLDLYSKILHEQRKFFIYLPASYYDDYFYKRRYPVVYALDGDSHFFNLAAMIKQMSENGDGTQFPEMIVVSIPNTNRNRDLTPTRDTTEHRMGMGDLNNTGGGEQFLSFISSELIPHIDSLYPTTPYRVFIGHSLGGLTVINALVHHKAQFNAYLAIDPSMMWNQLRLLHEAQTLLPTADYSGRSLFMATANSLQNGMDTTSVMRNYDGSTVSNNGSSGKGSSGNSSSGSGSSGSGNGSSTAVASLLHLHMQSMFLLRNALSATSAVNHLSFRWKYYPDYTHQTVPLPAEYDGLRFLFDFYQLDFPFETFFQPTYKADTLLAAHFDRISRRMGYTVSPPEVFVNNIAYNLLGNHQLDRAFYYFGLNIQNYPNSFNVYDSMGDLYLARNDKDRAAGMFKKSLSLHENPETRKKLDALEKN